jgi:cytidylate kinase
VAIITVSRGTFSGGRAVAEGVAARLRYPCVSLETLDAEPEDGRAEERAKRRKDDPSGLLIRLNRGRAALIRSARDGNFVYHGFAGHLLLPGVSHVLRVRIIAGMEYRIQAAMAELGFKRERAVAMIKDMDEESMKRALALYGVRWNDPSLYDVVMNLDQIGEESAILMVLRFAELPEFRPTGESRRAFEDLTISSRVWAALAMDERTRRADVRVACEDGIVTITGNVGSEKALAALPLVANGVEGVKEVRCEAAIGAHWIW